MKQEYDIVLSHGVFHYFPNEEYAFSVLTKAIELTKHYGKLMILDLIDINKYEDYISFRQSIDNGNYDRQGPTAYNHLPFDKLKIKKFLKLHGFSNIITFQEKIEGYSVSKFKFGIIATKGIINDSK